MRRIQEGKWAISDVSPDVRKVALQAAQREHMKLGVWLERAIKQASESRIPKIDVRQPENPRPHRRYF